MASRQSRDWQLSGLRERRNSAHPYCEQLLSQRAISGASTLEDKWRWAFAALVLVCALAAIAAVVSNGGAVFRLGSDIQNESLYGSAVRHRLKSELLSVSDEGPANALGLQRRAGMLASKVSIPVKPSEVKSLLNVVPTDAMAKRTMAEIQGSGGAIAEKRALTQSGKFKGSNEFRAARSVQIGSEFLEAARAVDLAADEAISQSLSQRTRWIWGVFALSWTMLAVWLLYATSVRRRHNASLFRERAILAMEQAISARHIFRNASATYARSTLQNNVACADGLAVQGMPPGTRPAITPIQPAVTALQGPLCAPLPTLVTTPVTIVSAESGAAAQVRTHVETFEFDQLVRDVCDSLQGVANGKGLFIQIEFAHSPMTVSADSIRIAYVLRTLVEIAIRCTHSGHVLVKVEEFVGRCIETQRDALACDAVSDEIPMISNRVGLARFSVHHWGRRTPVSNIASLHDAAMPFALSSHTLERDLAQTRHTLQQLGGTIFVETREAADPEGHGTTSTVSIPVSQVEEAEGFSDVAEAVDALNVLVVDQLSDVGHSIADAVVRLGHRCIAVSSALEARPLLVSTQFDAVLIDREMTNTDGLSLAAKIRQEQGPNAASMLILTGLAEDQALSHEWPFDGFLQKPINDEALTRLIGSRS